MATKQQAENLAQDRANRTGRSQRIEQSKNHQWVVIEMKHMDEFLFPIDAAEVFHPQSEKQAFYKKQQIFQKEKSYE